jgi:chitodextrinase
LIANSSTSSGSDLSWNASIDIGGSGVAGYKIFRLTGGSPFAQIATTPTTTFTDAGLLADTTYSYMVRAYDSSGNVSDPSNIYAVTTIPASETVPPTVPQSLVATILSETKVQLTWTGSTDTGGSGLVGYIVERSLDGAAFSSIVTLPTTTYENSGLTPATMYWYRVQAYDNSGNQSGYSNIVSITTAVVAPSVEVASNGGGGGNCGLMGLDLLLPLGLLWLRGRRGKTVGRRA